MKNPNMIISVERRPCKVKIEGKEEKKALFHRWSYDAMEGEGEGNIMWTEGIVELEDGSIKEVPR